jgi:NAD(P)-dependent dehydrogenase (short-subunit alcohol dehydrogenase family)
MNPSYDFSGQVALVTGACAGMGLATARAFAAAGRTAQMMGGSNWSRTTTTKGLQMQAFQWAILGSNQ